MNGLQIKKPADKIFSFVCKDFAYLICSPKIPFSVISSDPLTRVGILILAHTGFTPSLIILESILIALFPVSSKST